MKGMKKLGIRSVAMISSLSLLATPITAYATDRDTSLTSRVDHTDENFEDYEYVEMKESDFDAIVANLPDIVDDTSKADEVLEIIIGMEDYYNDLNANATIAHIYSDLDADNEEYDARVQYCSDLGTSVGDKIQINYNLIATSNNSDVLRARVEDDDEWQDILDYKPMTDEQKEWDSLETELSLKYDTLYNEEHTVTINGVEYLKEELSDAVLAGEIDYYDFLDGYYTINKERNEALAELYIELVEVRTNIAQSYGYDNYAEYAYDKIYDREYAPTDLDDYKDQVKEYYSPLLTEVYDEYSNGASDMQEMWEYELSVDEAHEIFVSHLADVSDDMLESYYYMVDHNLCNLDVSDTKAPGGYTTSISGRYNAPFMYNCADGNFSDLNTLIHEFGHYNEMYFASYEEWYYGGCNLDLAEIHSQGLELIYTEWEDEMYGEYADAMRLYNQLNQVYVVVEGAKEDTFQYNVYTHADNLTVDKLNEMYYDACVEFGDEDLYDSTFLSSMGYGEKNQILEWVEIPHTFQSPMYYISYSISMAGVEELRCELNADRDAAIEKYLQLVNIGTDAEYTASLEEVGINSPIENPRFELYAHNQRLLMGIDDGYVVDGADDVLGNPDDADDADDDADDTDDSKDKKKKKDKDKGKKDQDADKESDGESSAFPVPFTMLVAGCAGLGVLIVIIIIIAAVSASKKKKAKAAANNSYVPPVPPAVNPVYNPVNNPAPPQMPSASSVDTGANKQDQADNKDSNKAENEADNKADNKADNTTQNTAQNSVQSQMLKQNPVESNNAVAEQMLNDAESNDENN